MKTVLEEIEKECPGILSNIIFFVILLISAAIYFSLYFNNEDFKLKTIKPKQIQGEESSVRKK